MVSLLLSYHKKTMKLVRILLYYTTCCNDREVSCFSNNAISVSVPIANKRYDDLPRFWLMCLQQNQKRDAASLHNDTRVVCVHTLGHQAEDQIIREKRVMLAECTRWVCLDFFFPFLSPLISSFPFPFRFFVCIVSFSFSCCINPPLSFICHAYSRSNNNNYNNHHRRHLSCDPTYFISQWQ